MRRVLLAVAAVMLSGCKPELSFFLEFRPNRVLLDDTTATLRLDVFRPQGYFGPVAVSAELRHPDGLPLMGGHVSVNDPWQEALSNGVRVALDSAHMPAEVIVVAHGELDGETRDAQATLDMSLVGTWTLSPIVPEAAVDRGSTVTLVIEATGFAVDGILDLELQVQSVLTVIHRDGRATRVTTNGRNNAPIARWSSTFTVPSDARGPLKARVTGRIQPTPPMNVMEASQVAEFELPVNE